jgi:hypothetical protein
MKTKCQACGVEKDTEVLEYFPYDHGIIKDEPIPPLLTIGCQPNDTSNFRKVTVCHSCFFKLDPDMWIGEECWKKLNPVVPFKDLPFEKIENPSLTSEPPEATILPRNEENQ